MKVKQHLEQSMQEEQIREALNTHWHASAAGDANAEHDIYDDDVICDYPQSGERILGRRNLLAFPFPYIANTLGWMTAELGRQPWLVYPYLNNVVEQDYRRVKSRVGRSEPNSIGFWSKYAMPDGPDVASNNADIEIVAPRNEVTETTVSPGRNPVRLKNRPGPAGRMRLNIKEQTLSAYW